MLSNSSKTLPKRMGNQNKTRQSCGINCATDEAAEGVSVAEETLNGDPKNQTTIRSTHQSGIDSVTTPSHIRTNEPQPRSKELYQLSFHSEVTETPQIFTSFDNCNWDFMELEGQCLVPDTPEHITQSQIAEPFDRKLGILEQGEEPVQIITAMDCDPSISTNFLDLNSNFAHFPIESTLDTDFDFGSEVDISRKWLIRNTSSGFSGPITTAQASTDSPRIKQTEFCTYPGQNCASDLNENRSHGTDVISGPSFYDKSQGEAPPDQIGVLKPLVGGYSDQVQHGAEMSKPSLSPRVAASRKNCGKRSSLRGHKGGVGERSSLVDSGRPYSRGQKLFACPFHKKSPQKHQTCGKYTLRRIKDVKQHLYRHHCRPELYCPRCSQNFKRLSERNNHIRRGGCILKEVPNLNGILSENQKEELKNYGCRGTSIEQQWMELWKVIFPGAASPQSPYVESDQAELLSCLRKYWDNNASQILARSLDEQRINSLGLALITVVNIILDHFETNPANWDVSTSREGSGMSGQPPAYEDWFGGGLDFWERDFNY